MGEHERKAELQRALSEFRALTKDLGKLRRDVHRCEDRLNEAWIRATEAQLSGDRRAFLQAEIEVGEAYEAAEALRRRAPATQDEHAAALDVLDRARRRFHYIEEVAA